MKASRAHGRPALRGIAVASVLVLGALGAVVHAEPPRRPPRALPGVDEDPKKSGPELPPPPDTGGDDAADDAGVPPELTEEQKLELRMRELDDHLAKAQLAEKKDRWDEAIREYSAALDLQPGDPTALLGLAVARKTRETPGRCSRSALRALLALATYDPRGAWLEQRKVAIEWMGECGDTYAQERLALAKELAEEEPGAAGRPDDIRLTLGKLLYAAADDRDPAERPVQLDAVLKQLEQYRAECRDRSLEIQPEALRLEGDIYREKEAFDDAIRVYNELLARPLGPHSRGVDGIVKDLELERSLRELEKTQGFRPTEEAEAAYGRGLAALRVGDLVTAQSQLDAAIGTSPWFPRAYHTRGVVHARNGRFTKAVDDLKRAVWMDRSDYEAHIKLGMIYKKEFAGAEDESAIEHLEAALRLRPDLDRLHLLLGELYARTDRQKAREHYARYVELSDLDDADADKARRAIAELEREIRQDAPPDIAPPAEKALRFLPPKLQRLINEAYLRGTEHQDWAEAERTLLSARDEFPDEPIVLNQLARVVFAQGREGDARQYWEQSLGMREDQMEVHEQLGLLLRGDLPDAAIGHLRRAAELGSLTARYVLAELLWEQAQPIEASEQLDAYLAEAGDYDLFWDRAQALEQEIARRFLQFYLATGLVIAFVTIVPTWRLYRHYRGASLGQLLEREPKSFPEVARILSLIRHEILKHNTAFLSDVGRALELDEPDAEPRAAVLARRMFGDPADTRSRRAEPAGIYGRFLGYLEQLEQVGRAHRVTLNLHRKDPIFRPMIKAFEDIAARSERLRHPDRLRTGAKLELARAINRAGDVLGRRAFEQLSGLIRELCIVNVDRGLVASIYDQVVGEKQFAGQRLAPLQVGGAGAQVRIFRTDFEDIVANVVRNSLRSSLLWAAPPVGLGIDLVVEVDEITGLSTLAIRVKDRSPEQLSNEMLRGRYVERGMGITVDLLSRYDGAIAVEHEAGWSKAVVLRFFTVEDDGSSINVEAAA
jgi:tetratricopeptide (TPR) repeat protein